MDIIMMFQSNTLAIMPQGPSPDIITKVYYQKYMFGLTIHLLYRIKGTYYLIVYSFWAAKYSYFGYLYIVYTVAAIS